MEVKKSSKANLENKKGIFFEIGLIVALACIFLAFEWKVDVKMEEGFIVINTEEQLDEEIIPVTQRMQQALPPPPPAPRLTDLIQIVDEEINLDDNLDIMDVEANVANHGVYDFSGTGNGYEGEYQKADEAGHDKCQTRGGIQKGLLFCFLVHRLASCHSLVSQRLQNTDSS